MISLFFKEVLCYDGNWEAGEDKGAEQMPGGGRHLADAWEACQGCGESPG